MAFSAAGAGNTATWDFTGVGLPDGTYQVSATWSAHPNRATNAPYTINGVPVPGGVDQTVAPGDFVSDGGSWEVLGNVAVAGGVLVVELPDAGANGFVLADAIRVQQVDIQVVDQIDESAVIDDGDLQFTISGGTEFTYAGSNNALNNDIFFFPATLVTAGALAEWDFHVDPGFYAVGVSWEEHTNRATDASYSITTPSGVNDTTVVVDQTFSTASNQGGAGAGTVILDGKPFQILTTLEVPELDKQITVNLSDVTASGTGFLVADGAFVLRLADPVLPLMLSGTEEASSSASPLTASELNAAVSTALAAWSSTDLNEGQQRGVGASGRSGVAVAGLDPGLRLGFDGPGVHRSDGRRSGLRCGGSGERGGSRDRPHPGLRGLAGPGVSVKRDGLDAFARSSSPSGRLAAERFDIERFDIERF